LKSFRPFSFTVAVKPLDSLRPYFIGSSHFSPGGDAAKWSGTARQNDLHRLKRPTGQHLAKGLHGHNGFGHHDTDVLAYALTRCSSEH
jgi:hypothetical protein